MAKFNSHLVSTIRGSVAGINYTSNQFQQNVARRRISPVNPNTTYQSNVRSAFAGAETLWQNLSDSQRDAWNDYASELGFTGPLGPYTVPGRQVFIGNIGTATYWKQRGAAIAAIVGTPPVIPGFLDLDDVAPIAFVGAAETGISVSCVYNGTEDVEIMMQRSVAYNPSRYRFKGPFSSATMDFLSIAAPASGFLEFDGLAEDYIYFVLVRAITKEAPFRMSAKYFIRCIAETNV